MKENLKTCSTPPLQHCNRKHQQTWFFGQEDDAYRTAAYEGNFEIPDYSGGLITYMRPIQ